jgi:hypothetical protein
MKKLFSLFLLAGVLLITSCSNPEKEFKKAEVLGTCEAYEQYAKQYPSSPFTQVALQRADDIAFTKAKTQDGWRTLNDYLSGTTKHSHEAHEAEARNLMVTRQFEEAIASNSIPLLRQLLATQTNASSAPAAREHLAGLLAKQIEAQGNKTPDLESFAKEFAGTKAVSEIKSLLVKRHYYSALSVNTITSLKDFIDENPDSEWADNARRALVPLVEGQDWDQAVAQDTVASYRNFYYQHPTTTKLTSFRGTITLSRPPGGLQVEVQTTGGGLDSISPLITGMPRPGADDGVYFMGSMQLRILDKTFSLDEDQAVSLGLGSKVVLATGQEAFKPNFRIGTGTVLFKDGSPGRIISVNAQGTTPNIPNNSNVRGPDLQGGPGGGVFRGF